MFVGRWAVILLRYHCNIFLYYHFYDFFITHFDFFQSCLLVLIETETQQISLYK